MTTRTCPRCLLRHSADEPFVSIGTDASGHPMDVETCAFERQWAAAHVAPQPPGAVAYHLTGEAEVLASGLDPGKGRGTCKHVCLAETAEMAAGIYASVGGDVELTILAVDISGLDLYFECGEARHHDTVIEASRVRVLEPQLKPKLGIWRDPAWRRNHTDCLLRAHGRLVSRRVLHQVDAELRRRFPYGDHNVTHYFEVVAELEGAA